MEFFVNNSCSLRSEVLKQKKGGEFCWDVPV